MTRRIRRLFFGFFFFLFLIVGAYLIILTNGWMIDLSSFKIVKTGSISLTFTPKDASVFIDNTKQTEKNSFLSSNVVFKKLLPGIYRIYIEKEGYIPWKKTLSVSSEFVTTAHSIFLFPKEWKKEILATSTSDFFLTQKGLATESGSKIFFDNKMLFGSSVYLAKQNSHTLITEKRGVFYFINLDTPETELNISEIFKNQKKKITPAVTSLETIQKIEFHPLNKEKLIISTQKGIYELDPQKPSLERLLDAKTLSYAHVGNKWIFGINSSSTLFVVDTISKTSREIPFETNTIETIQTNGDDSLLFILSKTGKLFVISTADGIIQKTFSHVFSFSLNPNERKIAIALDSNSVVIYYFEEEFIDVYQEKESRRVLPVFPFVSISHMKWSESAPEYLLFKGGSKLVFSETDERTPVNYTTPFSDIKKFEEISNTIYILTNSGDLFSTKIEK